MWCPKCKVLVLISGKFCQDCGETLTADKTKCPYCKEDIYRGHKFCPECGKPIQEEGGGKKN